MNMAIGGYFELELPEPRPFLYPMARQFQSARAAFLALLRTGRPSRVFIPHYLCDSMLLPLKKAGVECIFYSMDDGFNIRDDIDLRATDWLLYVNYFGVCGNSVDRLRARYAPRQLVLDHSQAFYAAPRDCLATIYSPRKFFGVPDGGLLVTALPISEAQGMDQGSLARASSGLTRLAQTAEAGYAAYQEAEASLEQCEPLEMSQLSRRILHSVDIEAARMRRNANFAFLHQQLGSCNALALDLDSIDGPLCYPLLADATDLRAHLIRERIFVATYWPEVASRVGMVSQEREWVRNLLPLPCDHRYGLAEMQRIAQTCLPFLSGG